MLFLKKNNRFHDIEQVIVTSRIVPIDLAVRPPVRFLLCTCIRRVPRIEYSYIDLLKRDKPKC